MIKKHAALIFLILLLGGCALLDNGEEQSDYEETKQMVVDVLQTEEGKKAIQDVLKEEDMKEELVMEQDFIKETIQNTLAAEQAREYWQNVMKDPEFASIFASNMVDENERLLKGLMKDPEYQAMMLDVMKDPEMEENFIELMETKDYRDHIMDLVAEAMESPLFAARVSELLQEIAKNDLMIESSEGGDNQEENDEQQENESEEDEFGDPSEEDENIGGT